MSLNVELLQSSFNLVKPHAGELVEVFYTTLFSENPQVRDLFPASMDEQKKKLIGALSLVVTSLEEPEKLGSALRELGARHVSYGAVEAHYPIVGGILLRALAQVAGDAWTAELETAWGDAYGAIQDIMLEGAEAA